MKTISLFFVLLTLGCGHTDPGEDHGDLLVKGLTLTQTNHEAGWQRTECYSCHLPTNIHVKNNSATSLDLKTIQDYVAANGETSCSLCHGTNGN